MLLISDPKIINLSRSLPSPLYVVGGCVRNYLIDGSVADDIDLAAPIPVGELFSYLEKYGIEIVADYKRTGTVVFKTDRRKYEFTSFRKDEYTSGGAHIPIKTSFTENILDDARRRDFKCNAVYFDIARGEIVDPLGGTEDIKNKILDTVVEPSVVFGHDGLRLMRLARFAGELGFSPTPSVMAAAKNNSENIKDISAERVYDELKKILASDGKYPFSDPRGHYVGLKILDETGVLDYIIPELTLGRGMSQTEVYHNYDVLEHSLRATLYSDRSVRLATLLHDVAKPYCKIRYGRYRLHGEEGGAMAERVLKRLKTDNKTIKTVKFLVGAHMYDFDWQEDKTAVRKFIVKNFQFIKSLLLVKQADYSGYKDDLSVCGVVKKWENIIAETETDGTPFCLKDLDISAEDLLNAGVPTDKIGKVLDILWDKTIENPTTNEKSKLIESAKEFVR